MTAHRRYFFSHPDPYLWPEGRYELLMVYLRRVCEDRWWFNEPVVEGVPFGRLSFSITVSGRDQWFCHRRVMNLAHIVYGMLGLPVSALPVPDWETLERRGGRYQVPASPWGG